MQDDAASNPLNDGHLPVGGETSDEGDGVAPDIADDYTPEQDEEGNLSPVLDDEEDVEPDTDLDDEDDETVV